MTAGFKLIQAIGLTAMGFETTGHNTLSFEESKKIAEAVIASMQENAPISPIALKYLLIEVQNAKLGDQ